jgi:hypothetical protein
MLTTLILALALILGGIAPLDGVSGGPLSAPIVQPLDGVSGGPLAH